MRRRKTFGTENIESTWSRQLKPARWVSRIRTGRCKNASKMEWTCGRKRDLAGDVWMMQTSTYGRSGVGRCYTQALSHIPSPLLFLSPFIIQSFTYTSRWQDRIDCVGQLG